LAATGSFTRAYMKPTMAGTFTKNFSFTQAQHQRDEHARTVKV